MAFIKARQIGHTAWNNLRYNPQEEVDRGEGN